MGTTSHLPSELWQRELIFNRSISAKLWELGRSDLSSPLEMCHTSETYCHCLNCKKFTHFFNRCDRFYCPICVSRLAYRRRKSIEAWTKTITQPKHIVLTARNVSTITKNYVHWFKTQLCHLRRSKFARSWRGGLASLEVTNEGRGWHLHCHLLVDSDWIDHARLAQIWAKYVDQDFAIVCVKDTRERSYLSEVTKYAVKGSLLASWTASDIAAFIDAMTGVRQFGVFGSLFKDRAKRAQILAELTPPDRTCPACDSDALAYLDQMEHDWFEETGQRLSHN